MSWAFELATDFHGQKLKNAEVSVLPLQTLRGKKKKKQKRSK